MTDTPTGPTEPNLRFPPPKVGARSHGTLPSTPPGPHAPPHWKLAVPDWWSPPRLSAAGWLATVGSTMLLVASIVVVASRWTLIAPEFRFAGLVGSLVAVYVAAEWGRSRLPATSTALAVLAACLTAPTAIAASATLAQPWPVCILVGGIASLLATELQARRWRVRTLHALTTVAFGLSAVGAAAAGDVPVQYFGAFGAVAAFALGARKRSVALATATAASPLVGAWIDDGFGSGTVGRLGLTDGPIAWSGPTTGVVCAVVVGAVAIANSSRRVAQASFAIAASGVVAWWGVADVSASTAWSVFPIALLVLLALREGSRRSENVVSDLAAVWSTWSSLAMAPFVIAAPPFVSIAIGLSEPTGSVATVALFALVGVALAATAILDQIGSPDRQTIAQHDVWRDLVVTGGVGSFVCAVAFAGAGAEVTVLVAVFGWLAASAATSWRTWPLTTLTHSFWILAFVGVSDAAPGMQVAMIVTAGSMLAVALLATTSSVLAVTGIPATVMLTTTMVVGVIERDATVALATAVAAIASTGLFAISGRATNLAVFAGSFGTVTVLLTAYGEPWMLSLAVLLVASQMLVIGGVLDELTLRRTGAAGATGAILSSWWTSGANDWTIGALAPHGITGVDLAVGAIGAAMILAGVAVHRTTVCSSWAAYGPGLAMTSAWLLARQTDTDTSWATFAGFIVGVTAVAIGGLRRLGSALVIGSTTLAGTAVVSAGPRLSEAPTWLWIAAGGVGLLALAAVVERTERPLLPDDQHPGHSIVDMVRQEFR